MRRSVSFFFAFIFTIFPLQLFADDFGQDLWLDLSVANIEEHSDDEGFYQLNDNGTGHLSLTYELRLNRILSLGAGYVHGESDEVTLAFTDWFTDSKLEYNAVFGSAKLHLPLSRRNSLFLDIRGYEYDYEVIDNSIVLVSDKGSDVGYSFGWRIRFNDKLGMEVARESMPMGSDITIRGARVGISYSF